MFRLTLAKKRDFRYKKTSSVIRYCALLFDQPGESKEKNLCFTKQKTIAFCFTAEIILIFLSSYTAGNYKFSTDLFQMSSCIAIR